MDENLAEVPAGIQRHHPAETFERRGHIEGHKRQRNLDSYQQPDDQDDCEVEKDIVELALYELLVDADMQRADRLAAMAEGKRQVMRGVYLYAFTVFRHCHRVQGLSRPEERRRLRVQLVAFEQTPARSVGNGRVLDLGICIFDLRQIGVYSVEFGERDAQPNRPLDIGDNILADHLRFLVEFGCQ